MPKRYKRKRKKSRGIKTKVMAAKRKRRVPLTPAEHTQRYRRNQSGDAGRLSDVKPSARATQRYPQVWAGCGKNLVTQMEMRNARYYFANFPADGELVMNGDKCVGRSVRLEDIFTTANGPALYFLRLDRILRDLYNFPAGIDLLQADPI